MVGTRKVNGFLLEYSTLELFTECGGTYSNASGIMSSPSYPNQYPGLADCVYLNSQPEGTFVNISFITMDIDCQGTPSDYIELRDGNSEESPLMGTFCGNGSNVPVFMQTTQNNLRIRLKKKAGQQKYNSKTVSLFFIIRFFSNSFESALGFQLEYESSDVFQGMINRFDECGLGGYFSTTNGTITSPSYPDNYPGNADCIYTISQPTGTVILLNFLSMDIEDDSTCRHDYLEIRDGSTVLDKLCGNEIPAPIQSSKNQLWMK